MEFPTLRKIARHSIMRRNIDYSFLSKPELLGLIPMSHRDVLEKASEMKFNELISFPNKGLEVSARYGFVEAFVFFKELGATSFVKAIRFAAEHGHIEIVKLCKRKVANYNFAMNYAAEGSFFSIINLLLSWGANDVDTAMGHAALKGNLDMVKFLRRKGAKDLNRSMALAARKGHLDVVRYLQRKGARKYNAALMEAALNYNVDVVDQCLAWGAYNLVETIRKVEEKRNTLIEIIDNFDELKWNQNRHRR